MEAFQTELAIRGMVDNARDILRDLTYLVEHGGMPDGYGGDMLRESVEGVKAEADSLMVKFGEVNSMPLVNSMPHTRITR